MGLSFWEEIASGWKKHPALAMTLGEEIPKKHRDDVASPKNGSQ
jgi:hypothetical protein